MLNLDERSYFDALAGYIKHMFGVEIDILPANHSEIIPTGDREQVLGCCHRINDNNGGVVAYLITIDEAYIRSCYCGRQTPYSPYSDNQLIETICHEIAHLYIWEHGKEHTALTNELYNAVINSIKKEP